MAAKKPAPAKDKEEAAPASKKSNLLVIVLIAVIVLMGAGGGAAFFLMGKKEPATAEGGHGDGEEDVADSGEGGDEEDDFEEEEDHGPKLPAVYVKLEPAFIVNLSDPAKQRYLQADISIMTRSPEGEKLLEENMPLVRNTLLMLLSQQEYDVLVTREGKEKLQEDALTEVRTKLKSSRVKVKVEELLFTSLVMQ